MLGADEARQADQSGGSRNVFHRHRGRDARAAYGILHDARGLVPSPSGGGRSDQAKLLKSRPGPRSGPGGVRTLSGLRVGGGGAGGQCRQRPEND